MGHPKLTPEKQQEICEIISKGNYAKIAALACNISEKTYYDWLKKRKVAKSGPFFEFYEALQAAEARSQIARMERINQAGASGDWQADAWTLERRWPDLYGRKERLEHSGSESQPVQVVQMSLDDWTKKQATQKAKLENTMMIFADEAE